MDQVLENESKVIQEMMVPVQQLQANPWNRKTFDLQGMQELTDSVKSKGILEPLIVRKMQDGKYEIASGERRWRAAMHAGLKEVPCRDMVLTDEDVQDLNLIANIQREDIPALEKAALLKARMGNTITQAQIAKKLGKSQEWVSSLLGFLDLPKEVHENISEIPLGMAHLQAIASLPTPEYQEQLAQEIKEGKVSLEDVHKRAHHLNTGFRSSQAKRQKKAENTETPSAERGVRREEPLIKNNLIPHPAFRILPAGRQVPHCRRLLRSPRINLLPRSKMTWRISTCRLLAASGV